MGDSNVTDISKFRKGFGESATQTPADPAPENESGDQSENDEGPIHQTLLEHLAAQTPNLIQYFRDSMQDLLRDMNLEATLTKQTGSLNGEKLNPAEALVVNNTTFAFWMYVEPPLWDVVMASYEDHLWTYNSDKFRAICETIGADALDHYLATGTHKNEAAARAAFENAYKDEMKPLALLADMAVQHMPGLTATTAIHHGPDFITPVITLKSKDGRDLRDHLRTFLNVTPKGTRPLLKPV